VKGNVKVLWNQAVHTDRKVTANRPDIIIKKTRREIMHSDRCGNTRRQKRCAKGSGEEVKIQELNSLSYYAVDTQHTKTVSLLQPVIFGYMFRPLPGHHQANKE